MRGVRTFGVLFAGLLAGLLGIGQAGIPPATAQVMLPTLTSCLRVDFAAESKGGRPRLTGYVYNTWDKWATDVRLLVEALDEAGQVVGSSPVFRVRQSATGRALVFRRSAHGDRCELSLTVQTAHWRTFGAGGG